nr:MAG TPA: General transcription and DNA repair, DNA repair, helicase, multiprotein.7A [Caudoviricetes sp.]
MVSCNLNYCAVSQRHSHEFIHECTGCCKICLSLERGLL